MLPLMAVLAFSVKLCPPWPPIESPVEVSGMVESVDAMIYALKCYEFKMG